MATSLVPQCELASSRTLERCRGHVCLSGSGLASVGVVLRPSPRRAYLARRLHDQDTTNNGCSVFLPIFLSDPLYFTSFSNCTARLWLSQQSLLRVSLPGTRAVNASLSASLPACRLFASAPRTPRSRRQTRSRMLRPKACPLSSTRRHVPVKAYVPCPKSGTRARCSRATRCTLSSTALGRRK